MPIQFRSLPFGLQYASFWFSNHSEAGIKSSLITSASAHNLDHPFLLNVETNHQEDSLCEICSRLNFVYLFSQPLADCEVETSDRKIHKLVDGIRLGSWYDIQLKSSTCQFCQLVSLTLASHPESEEKNVDCYLSNIVSTANRHFMMPSDIPPSDHTLPRQWQISVRLQSAAQTKNLSSRPIDGELLQQVSTCYPPDPRDNATVSKDCSGLVIPGSLDYSRISNWLSDCIFEQSWKNSDEFHENFRPIKPMKLIDTTKMCVVNWLSGTTPYVALSYVWGPLKPLVLISENYDKLHCEFVFEDDAVRRRLPKTILEAISLCQSIGERYLWVDSLCIVQDSQQKLEQISQMDQIYWRAKMTIVAAAGSDANAGLVGVNPTRPRTSQIIRRIRNMDIANVLPGISTVDSVYWNTRGWTYQERLLSRRKLYITEGQIYFQCQHGTISEDSQHRIHSYPIIAERPSYTPGQLNLLHMPNVKIYEHVVSDYLLRNLTNANDIDHALKGIMNVLISRIFPGSQVTRGIPHEILDLGLLWQPGGPLTRRAGFPSWSWEGWVGPMEYPPSMDIAERTLSLNRWSNYIGTTDKEHKTYLRTALQLDKPRNDWWQPSWERHFSDDGEIYYTEVNGDPDVWFSYPRDANCMSNDRNGSSHISHDISDLTRLMVPLAQRADLIVTGHHADVWYKNSGCDRNEHEVCHLAIFDDNYHQIGIVTVDGNIFKQLCSNYPDKERYTFVKLSQTTLSTGRDDPAWDEQTNSFLGRPGEPSINPQMPLDKDQEIFDQDQYNINICWGLYNVMMVDAQPVALDCPQFCRIGVGQVHIHGFDRCSHLKVDTISLV